MPRLLLLNTVTCGDVMLSMMISPPALCSVVAVAGRCGRLGVRHRAAGSRWCSLGAADAGVGVRQLRPAQLTPRPTDAPPN
jgi:hypothetical protein